MPSAYKIVFLGICCACFGISGQADVTTEDRRTQDVQTGQKNSPNVSTTEADRHTFRPFQQFQNETGSVHRFVPTYNISHSHFPTSNDYDDDGSVLRPIFNGTKVPLFSETQVPFSNENQAPPPEDSAAGHILPGGGEALGFPWHAGIYSKTFSPFMQICGGTLVSLKAVISAAHCFWNDVEGAQPAEKFAAATGKRYRPWADPHDKFAQRSGISAIHIPPRFRGIATSFQEDIAVVFLADAFTATAFVRPACVSFDEELEKEQLQKGNLGTVLGWGLTQEDGPPSPILNYLELPYVGDEECLATSSADFLKYITVDKICAGVTTGKALCRCRGDSGGGWVVRARGAPYLRGVASTAARNQHECNAHALAALTSVSAHRPFLLHHLPGLERECRAHYPQIQNDIATRTGKPAGKAKKTRFVCNCHCNKRRP